MRISRRQDGSSWEGNSVVITCTSRRGGQELQGHQSTRGGTARLMEIGKKTGPNE